MNLKEMRNTTVSLLVTPIEDVSAYVEGISKGITVNKNSVPFDTEKPTITSGIRIGTPAVTTRGFKEKEMIEIAKLINMTVENYEEKQEEIKQEVANICKRFPLYE